MEGQESVSADEMFRGPIKSSSSELAEDDDDDDVPELLVSSSTGIRR
jgi:hypothetical protein